MDCVFCRIVSGELPAHRLYEDERVLAFLDIQPGTPGHSLVISKAHAATFLELAAEDRAAVFAAAQRLARALLAATGAEGFNLHQSNGSVAGQVVPHFHLHILPRRAGDSLRGPWQPGSAPAAELAALAAQVGRCLADLPPAR